MNVPFWKAVRDTPTITEVSLYLDGKEKQALAFVPWPANSYKPNVTFAMAHSDKAIYLKYYVAEKWIRAAEGKINGAVWEDSCVEFFIAFDEAGYYNLEFNCIGTTLVGFGKSKGDRKLLSPERISRIKYGVCINNAPDGTIQWQLTLMLPVAVFQHHHLSSLQGLACRANFFKCGDALHEPHFIAWSNIQAPEPDFHLPDFFGSLLFAKEEV